MKGQDQDDPRQGGEAKLERDLPKAKAAKNTDPMIPASNTETGKPLTRA